MHPTHAQYVVTTTLPHQLAAPVKTSAIVSIYERIFFFWLFTYNHPNDLTKYSRYDIEHFSCICLWFTVDCQIGHYPNASDDTACIPCEIGFYKDVTGAGNCTMCPDGFSTTDLGNRFISDCHGKSKYLHSSLTFFIMWLGEKNYMQKLMEVFILVFCCFILVICGLGQAPNATNTSQCIDCEIGYYSDIDGPEECTLCPNNLTTTYVASTMYTDCQG